MLTVYGIETDFRQIVHRLIDLVVATVLTVYGIETFRRTVSVFQQSCNSAYRLRY